ncbi:hypothetical protein SprV_0702246800 [Sparganum proliferum]
MWLRYVDDTFVIIKTCEIEQFHLSLNSVFPAIQFTREEATGGILQFLDVSIRTLSDGGLATSVYRKDSSADVMLNYESNHPAAHKRSCVRTLFHRAYCYCSTDDLLKKELAFLYRLFRLNGYPVSFVKNCLRQQRQPQDISSNEGPEQRKFYSLPYMQGISEAIARQLNRFGILIAHKPASSLRATLSSADGAATAFRWEHLETLNGASNIFYGWGGEDDDMLRRLRLKHLPIDRAPDAKGVFFEFNRNHSRERIAGRGQLIEFDKVMWRMQHDGIAQISYRLLKRKHYEYFVWMLFDL